MNLNSEYIESTVDHVLVFGPPKAGKTAAVAKLCEHYNLLWFDNESGIRTVKNPELKISKEALDHISYILLPDSKDYPIAAETMYKVVDWKAMNICHKHGKNNCLLCKDKLPFTPVDFSALDNSWVIVVDSMTQLSYSVMNMLMKAREATNYDAKPEWDDYMKQGNWLNRWLSVIQNCPYNVVIISHEMGLDLEDGKEKLIAMAGTKNYARTFSKFFDHVCYVEMKNRKHVVGSSTAYASNILTGSRTGAKTEDNQDNPLLSIFKNYRNYKKVV
jgi:hypothetical protein